MSARLLVFTDLDGTLLAHDDYDWTPSAPAVEALRRRGIPLVIASSKTRAEIEAWRTRIGVADPFISENGGALYVPAQSPLAPFTGGTPLDSYVCVAFGTPYARLTELMDELSHALGVPLYGFAAMSDLEVAHQTGLPPEDVARARRREWDEPFVPEWALSEDQEKQLAEAAAARSLRVTRGGRFHHLTGPNSKGLAARRLIEAHAAAGDPVTTIALGDGPNDLELLEVADHAVVVARTDGSHAPALRAALPGARFTRGIGPAGFAEGVLGMLERPEG